MKVAELIERLKAMPPEAEVSISTRPGYHFEEAAEVTLLDDGVTIASLDE